MTNIKATGSTDSYDQEITTDSIIFLQCTCWCGDPNDGSYTEEWNGDSLWMFNRPIFPKYKKKARWLFPLPEYVFMPCGTVIGNYSDNPDVWDLWLGKMGRYPGDGEFFDVRLEK